MRQEVVNRYVLTEEPEKLKEAIALLEKAKLDLSAGLIKYQRAKLQAERLGIGEAAGGPRMKMSPESKSAPIIMMPEANE